MFYQSTLIALVAAAGLTTAQVSDDFESGWDKTKWPIYAPDCNQGGSVTLDTTVAHSGGSSMKVVGGSAGYCGHVFFGTTSVPAGGDIYVRAWVKAKTALTANHITFITMTDSGLGANKHLRMGGQSEILMFNRETDDATLPALSPQGIAASKALPVGDFQCLEYHIGSDGTIETWLNSEAVTGLEAGPKTSNPNADQWGTSYKPAITGIYFGWESYSGDPNTFWYDDISIGSTRVGCAASGGGQATASNSATASATTVSGATSASTSDAASVTQPAKSTLVTSVRTTTARVSSATASSFQESVSVTVSETSQATSPPVTASESTKPASTASTSTAVTPTKSKCSKRRRRHV